MSSIPARAVVDASVAVKIFVPENLSVQAQSVFAQLGSQNDAEILVPDLFFIECANVFWKWVQRLGYPADKAREHLSDLMGLGLTAIPNQILAQEALGAALKYRITAYDAGYLVAAAELQLPLITADEKFVRQVAGSAHDVRWLGDLGA